MNIFYLDEDPKIAAQMHCDKHCVKMILESAQLLSTAHRELDPYRAFAGLYKSTHKNHPSTKWVRSSRDHYIWVYKLFANLCGEYTKRYGKIHKSWTKFKHHLSLLPWSIPREGWVDPPQCMPDYCKNENVVKAYRNYYILEKNKFAKWNYTSVPDWYMSMGST